MLIKIRRSGHCKLPTWRRMAPLLMLQVLRRWKKIEWNRLSHFQCGDLELKIGVMRMFAHILLVGINGSYFLRCSVNGSISFNNALSYYMMMMMILSGFYGMASSVSVVIGGKLCQETSGHGRKPDEPHNSGAPEELGLHAMLSCGIRLIEGCSFGFRRTVEASWTQPALIGTERLNPKVRRLSSQRQQQQGHISNPELSMHIFGLPRRSHLDVSQRCNDNVRWRPPDPMVNSCCYHLDGKNVCTPKVFWTPANPYTAHFYLDSGAAYHMTGNQFILQAYPDHLNIMLPTLSVSGIDGLPLPVRRCGFINTTSIRLDGIIYVEGLVANLVSVGQLAKLYSVRIVFEANLFTIEKIQTGEKIGQGHREGVGNLYVLDHFLPKYLLVENPACFV